jgi:mannose-6-phosphate isomerase-like protein (cupin superfamily)
MNQALRAGVDGALRAGLVIDVRGTRESLERSGGERQVADASTALEICVEAFNSPGPGELRVENRDVLYIVLDGSGVSGVEDGNPLPLVPGEAVVVPARARHVIFGNPRLSPLTVTTRRKGRPPFLSRHVGWPRIGS